MGLELNEETFEELKKSGTKKRREFICSSCGERSSGWPDSPRTGLRLCVSCSSGKPMKRRKR